VSVLVRAVDLTKEFRVGMIGGFRIIAVDEVNFEVREGEIFSIVGESGSGKTTIARMMLRLLRPTRGAILYRGKDVWKLKRREIKWFYREVQGIFQDPYATFNPVHKVDRVLNLVFQVFYPHTSERERRERIEEALKSVGLNPREVLGKYPHQLSGGQLQRIAIARALLIKPKLLVADEPVSMLDASTRIDVLNILAELRDREGVSTVLIGHDLSLAYYISDRVLVLYRGSIVEMGSVEDVFEKPLHPYTEMLLESIPRVDKKWEKRMEFKAEAEEREVYALSGCRFAPRCPYASSKCAERPPLTRVDKEHYVACWLYAKR